MSTETNNVSEPKSVNPTKSALSVIEDQGVSKAALAEIGLLLSRFALELSVSPRADQEEIISVERDGTFELFVKKIPFEQSAPRSFVYDTWAVYTPRCGTVRILLNAQSETILEPGDSLGIMPGDAAMIEPLDEQLEMCCLFGIARKHLPPPRLK